MDHPNLQAQDPDEDKRQEPKEQKQNGENSSASSLKIGAFSISKKAGDNKRKLSQVSSLTEKDEEEKEYITAISGNQMERCVLPSLSNLRKIEATYSSKAQPKTGPLVIPMPAQKAVKINKKYLNLVKRKGDQSAPTPMDTSSTSAATTTDQMDSTAQTPVQETVTPTNGSAQSEEKTLDQLATDELLKEAKGELVTVEADEDIELPMLLKFRNPDLDEIADEDKRFKVDVESRPDSSSLEEYDKIPVDKFGSALLRGMGWKPGAPVGLTNAKVIQPIEFIQRPGYRTGLGATVTVPPKKPKKYIKPGESRDDGEPKVLLGAEGQLRHTRTLDEKLVPLSKTGIIGGSFVSIVAGRHDGLYARVTKILPNQVKVRLEASGEEVLVDKPDLALVDGSQINEEHPAFNFMEEEQNRTDDRPKDTDNGTTKQQRPDKEKEKENKKKQVEQKAKEKPKEKNIWIFPNIVVRIISKSFGDGKYYLKKGSIVDVLHGDVCTLQLLETKKLLEVKQGMLETVIPEVDSKVLVVEGPNRGKVGKLMSKAKVNGETVAVVQLAGDFSVGNYNLDSICSYTGDSIY